MDIIDVLHTLEELEGKAAALYRKYSVIFSHDEEVADFFSKMAREEQSHVNLVKFEVGLVWSDRGQFLEVEVDHEETRQFLDMLSGALNDDSMPTLEEALKISIRLENSSSELYYRAAIVESNPRIKNLIDSMNKADKGHFDDLLRFVEKRGFFPPPVKKFPGTADIT